MAKVFDYSLEQWKVFYLRRRIRMEDPDLVHFFDVLRRDEVRDVRFDELFERCKTSVVVPSLDARFVCWSNEDRREYNEICLSLMPGRLMKLAKCVDYGGGGSVHHKWRKEIDDAMLDLKCGCPVQGTLNDGGVYNGRN